MKTWFPILGFVVLLVLGISLVKAPEFGAVVLGEMNPNVTQQNINQTICVPNWTATIRPPTSYTTPLKLKLVAGQNVNDFELDHLISLQLGGAPTSTKNLWLQPYPEARLKDTLENYLKRQVCAGQMTLQEAQTLIANNWKKSYDKYIGGKFGAMYSSDEDDN